MNLTQNFLQSWTFARSDGGSLSHPHSQFNAKRLRDTALTSLDGTPLTWTRRYG